jgi:hypothetical protein
MFPDTAYSCLLLALKLKVGWISTLAYETSTVHWPERFSVAYCVHIVQTILMRKKRRYPQKSMLTAMVGPQTGPQTCLSWCWDTLYWLLGSNMQHTAVNVLKLRRHPQIAGILYSSHIIDVGVFCCQYRRSPYLYNTWFLQQCPVTQRSWIKAGD